ncbi:glycosyltransferase [Lactobacillus crispatus]|uniref:glycosyltransferase n=1 Tax=Lactobacillus crispatus TaxID=47770 RepID=UPI0015DE7A1B|nr:glycosyltransferase [Lactobacillus crispatus]QLK32463.1 glycosyltransferase [Lactobacillus crispatus]
MNKINPIVSVIVPVYNVQKYLSQCIDSIVNQAYKNIEILLIDDGSTDESGKICDIYQKKYTNIKSFHKNNTGLGLTRNYGLARATGDFVMFVDSDDVLKNTCITELIKVVINDDVDTVIGGYTRIDNKKNCLFKEKYLPKIYYGKDVQNKCFTRMLGNLYKNTDSIKMSVWNCLYSMNIIKKNNLQFPSERKYISEDLIWDSEYFKYAIRVAISDSTSYLYRYNPLSLTNSYNMNRFILSIDLYSYVSDLIIKMKLPEEASKRFQKSFFIYVRLCIEQEGIRKFKVAIPMLKKICNNQEVQNVIKVYPIKKLGIKERAFLYLLKHKKAYCLYAYSKINKIIHLH